MIRGRERESRYLQKVDRRERERRLRGSTEYRVKRKEKDKVRKHCQGGERANMKESETERKREKEKRGKEVQIWTQRKEKRDS